MDADDPRRRPPSVIVCAISTAVATVVAYLCWLGVSTQTSLSRTAHEPNSDQPWQVVGLTITLLLIGGVVGWLGLPVTATVVIPAAATACFTFTALRDPAADGTSAALALLILVGGLVATAAAAFSAHRFAEAANQTMGRWQRPKTASTMR
jgi:hypothetical protein